MPNLTQTCDLFAIFSTLRIQPKTTKWQSSDLPETSFVDYRKVGYVGYDNFPHYFWTGPARTFSGGVG